MNKLTKNVGVIGLGSFLPTKIITNADLEKMVETSDEWITKRTGIKERRILEKDVPGYTMGVEASKAALKDAGIDPLDIGMIIVTSNTPDSYVPTTACIIQKEIGATNAAAFDMNAACTGFVYGLSVASKFIADGTYKNVLLVSVEALSRVMDFTDRNTCILFGDGAAAVVLSEVLPPYGLKGTYLGADGELGEHITLPALHITDEDIIKRNGAKNTIWMNGSEVFKFAVRVMESASNKILELCGMNISDVDLLIPHQANTRIIEGASKRLGMEPDKVFNMVADTGNMSSASIPVALCRAYEENKLKKGDHILLVGFGGGLTWGSAILTWSK